MRRSWAVAFLFLAGCSTAPLAGLMDCVVPSRLNPDRDFPARPNRDGRDRDNGRDRDGRDRDMGPLPPDVYPRDPRDSRNPTTLDDPIPVPPPGRPLPRN